MTYGVLFQNWGNHEKEIIFYIDGRIFMSGCKTFEKYVSLIPLYDNIPCSDTFEIFEEYINTNPC